MASTIKFNYNRKALACVINYDCKCDTTIWSMVIYDRNMFIKQVTGQRFPHSKWPHSCHINFFFFEAKRPNLKLKTTFTLSPDKYQSLRLVNSNFLKRKKNLDTVFDNLSFFQLTSQKKPKKA